MGFRMVLEAQEDLEVVGEAGDGAEAVALARELEPDVVLMDVRMPNMDGVQATRALVEGGSRSHIIILTTFDLDEYAHAGCGPARAASCSRTRRPPISSPRSARWPAARRSSRRARRGASWRRSPTGCP